MSIKILKISFLLLTFSLISSAQENKREFKIIHSIKTTSVKDQGRTGTCWAFATTSFVETELIRLGKDNLDLSEMFTVRYKLLKMAEKYVRYHGKVNFGDGGQAHDLLSVIENYGFVPEEIYTGKIEGQERHNQGEMMSVLQSMLDAVIEKKGGLITTKWGDAFKSLLDVYLGVVPNNFNYNNEQFTPLEFAKKSGFNPSDYVEITSYLHKPFYKKFILEIPDNWSNSFYYNIPIDEVVKIIDSALKKGFSVCWDGDSGRDHFLRNEGYAIIPEKETITVSNDVVKEKNITQEMRQLAFNNYDVTDDHLMHIVGLAEDQNGSKYYYTKNSWGTENRIYDGYWYMSEPYIRLKTIAILVHKDAIPREIRDKLKI